MGSPIKQSIARAATSSRGTGAPHLRIGPVEGWGEKPLPNVAIPKQRHQSEYSLVWDQAENRMHTIKAVMVATLGE